MTQGTLPGQGKDGAFIGRVREAAELAAALEDAVGGRGRLFLVTGEPGIGKTWLAEHLAGRALERGMEVLWGRCWAGGGARRPGSGRSSSPASPKAAMTRP